jgi:DNA-binding IscR family transcriptional regulator
MDIYQVIDGDYRSSACPLGKTQCLFADCIFRGRISEILAELHDKLASIHLSDIVSQKEPACITKTGLAKKK